MFNFRYHRLLWGNWVFVIWPMFFALAMVITVFQCAPILDWWTR